MASGNTLLILTPASGSPPATLAAQWDELVGTSTPAERVPVFAFDPTTVEYMDFYGVMPQNYAGGGVTLQLKTGGGTANGVYTFEVAFREVADDAEDLDTTAHTYDYNSVDITGPTAVGEVAYDTLAFTDGADMDSVGAGDMFVLRIKRNTADAQDTMATDAYLHSIEVRET